METEADVECTECHLVEKWDLIPDVKYTTIMPLLDSACSMQDSVGQGWDGSLHSTLQQNSHIKYISPVSGVQCLLSNV